jgi:hypothetical protein
LKLFLQSLGEFDETWYKNIFTGVTAPGLSIFFEKYSQLLLDPLGDFYFNETWYKERSHCVECENCKESPVQSFLKELWPRSLIFLLKNTSSQHLLNSGGF